MKTSVVLPRIADDQDIVDGLADFHEATRDITAWIPTIIDEKGAANPRDARWLRSFLAGPLAWHFTDEENVIVPRLNKRRSDWLDLCLARMIQKHERVSEAAEELLIVLEPLCAGNAVDREMFLSAARAFGAAVEDSLRYEDDVILPSARVFLDHADREHAAREITSSDETRPWATIATAGDAPVIHAIHTVRTRGPGGLEIVHAYADCPRRRSVSVDACHGCPHFEGVDVGGSKIACALDDTPRPAGARVFDVMTRNVVCVDPDTSVRDASRVLASACISGLPVVDAGGHPIGVVSQSDIVDAIAASRNLDELIVDDIMMHAPMVIRENDRVDDAARLLILEGIHRLPVVNAQNEVVGIVSTLDVLRATT